MEAELVEAADEKLAERPCEESAEAVRTRLCFVEANERDKTFPELEVVPTFPPPEKPTREGALRLPLPSPPTLVSSSSMETFFTVLTEVADTRRDRFRSRITSRSSDRFPRGVN